MVMEGSRAGNKRKRVYCVEAKKVAESAFTRNYVNYLIPALTNSSSSDFKNVKHQVDMAMALSAQGFAWSHRLKLNLLQTDEIHQEVDDDHHDKVPTTTVEASSSSSKNQRQTDVVKASSNNPSSLEVIEEEEDEDEKMKSQMSSLRKLIPGGEKIVDEDMVTELESYISCLKMQVNVLQCLLSLSSS